MIQKFPVDAIHWEIGAVGYAVPPKSVDSGRSIASVGSDLRSIPHLPLPQAGSADLVADHGLLGTLTLAQSLLSFSIHKVVPDLSDFTADSRSGMESGQFWCMKPPTISEIRRRCPAVPADYPAVPTDCPAPEERP